MTVKTHLRGNQPLAEPDSGRLLHLAAHSCVQRVKPSIRCSFLILSKCSELWPTPNFTVLQPSCLQMNLKLKTWHPTSGDCSSEDIDIPMGLLLCFSVPCSLICQYGPSSGKESFQVRQEAHTCNLVIKVS